MDFLCGVLYVILVITSYGLRTASGATCPLTGLAPQKPALPLYRCLAASEASCCSTCTDFTNPLEILSVNGSEAISILNPSLANIPSASGFASLQLCSFFVGQDRCLNLIEALSCAILCNADAERYLSASNSTVTLRVCNAFVNEAYAACANVSIPIIQARVETLFPSAADLFTTLLLPIVAASIPSITSATGVVVPDANGTSTCFNGVPESQIPASSICCDEFTNVPPQCLTQNNAQHYASQINRTISTVNCPQIQREAPNTAAGPLASSPISGPSRAPSSSTSPMSPSVNTTSASTSTVSPSFGVCYSRLSATSAIIAVVLIFW